MSPAELQALFQAIAVLGPLAIKEIAALVAAHHKAGAVVPAKKTVNVTVAVPADSPTGTNDPNDPTFQE